jgi:hypothetical protein
LWIKNANHMNELKMQEPVTDKLYHEVFDPRA